MPQAKTDMLARLEELLLDPERRDVAPRVGQIGHARAFSRPKSISESQRTIDFVCSTNDLDRHGEIIDVRRAFTRPVLDRFMLNPVFPYGHHYDATGDRLPTVGHWKSMRVEGDALIGTAWFKPRGLGEECFRDYIDGNLTSVSIAFIARGFEMREVELDGDKRRVRTFTALDLLEVSAVLVPALPQARIRAAAFAQTHGESPLLKRLESLLGKLESRLHNFDPDPPDAPASPDPDHGYQRWLDLDEDDAQAMRGYDRSSISDGYFGDILDEAGDAGHACAADESDDPELKMLVREMLGR